MMQLDTRGGQMQHVLFDSALRSPCSGPSKSARRVAPHQPQGPISKTETRVLLSRGSGRTRAGSYPIGDGRTPIAEIVGTRPTPVQHDFNGGV